MSQIFYSEPRQPEEKNSMAEWWGTVRQKSHGEPVEKKKKKSISTIYFIYNVSLEKLHTIRVGRQIFYPLTFPSLLPSLFPELWFFVSSKGSWFDQLSWCFLLKIMKNCESLSPTEVKICQLYTHLPFSLLFKWWCSRGEGLRGLSPLWHSRQRPCPQALLFGSGSLTQKLSPSSSVTA